MLRQSTTAGLWLLGVMAVFLVAGCVAGGQEQTLEERAQEIDRSLICPICPGETIDQSQVELANQMRIMVREKLAAGESREEILQFFVDRYGEGVLAAPPKRGFSLTIWIVPPLVVMGGGLILALTVRAMRRKPGEVERGEVAKEEELERYLSLVDAEAQEWNGPEATPEGRGPDLSGREEGS